MTVLIQSTFAFSVSRNTFRLLDSDWISNFKLCLLNCKKWNAFEKKRNCTIWTQQKNMYGTPGTYLYRKPKRNQNGMVRYPKRYPCTNRIKKRNFKKKNVGYLAKAHRELKQILRVGSVERNITSRASRTACSVRIWAHVNQSKRNRKKIEK